MIILGLGSNIGDRLSHLRNALRLIKQIPELSVQQVSPIYISDALLPDNTPKSWDMPYLNLAIRCHTTLSPYALLEKTKNIEKELGRKPEIDWGPRIIDIDILAWESLIKYDGKLHIPHEYLHERPFALWPLADVAPHWVYPLPGIFNGKTAMEIVAPWGSRFSGNAPLHTRQIQQRIDTPALVGILNITPDSFSDGGKFLDEAAALDQVRDLINSGAEIIDVGAEATGPKVIALDAHTEWQRLESFLIKIMTERSKLLITPKISVDTRHASVAKKALELGVAWINDVSGLDDVSMREVVAKKECDIVFMHHLGIPVSQSNLIPFNEDPVSHVYAWAEKRIAEFKEYDIANDRLILDVGIGFGKTAEQSLALIKNIDVFKKLGLRLLVGHSRKSFLSLFTPKPPAERDIETTVISLQLANHAVEYLRVHNVDMMARAFKVMNILK